MHSLDQIVKFNERWEQKEVYKAVQLLQRYNAMKRIEDARIAATEEMREQVADIKAANATKKMHITKEEIDAILMARL